MNDIEDKYKKLQVKMEKLNAENKRLRLRPSLHSTEANIFDFMNIKSIMSEAMLEAQTVQQALNISILYLTKITNIHSIAFFQRDGDGKNIFITGQKSFPKKLLTEFSKQETAVKFGSYIFPENNKYYYPKKDKEYTIDPFNDHLNTYNTRVILPIVKNKTLQLSLLLLSKKEYTQSQYFKIVIENIQAQLKSSFSRIIYQVQLEDQAENIELSVKNRVSDYQHMNRELMNQIHNSKKQVSLLSEKLKLYQGIVDKQKDIILRINREGDILFSNPSFTQLQFIGGVDKNNLVCYLGEGDFPGLPQIIHDFEEGMQQINYEIQVLIDYPVWFNFYFTPIKNKRGLIIEIQVSARNIDFIKSMEEKLRNQKNMVLNMLNNSNNIHFTMTKKGDLLFLSDNWEKILGFPQIDSINKNFSTFLNKKHYKSIENDIQSILLKYQDCSFYDFKLANSEGKKLPYKLKLSLAPSPTGKFDLICGILSPK